MINGRFRCSAVRGLASVIELSDVESRACPPSRARRGHRRRRETLFSRYARRGTAIEPDKLLIFIVRVTPTSTSLCCVRNMCTRGEREKRDGRRRSGRTNSDLSPPRAGFDFAIRYYYSPLLSYYVLYACTAWCYYIMFRESRRPLVSPGPREFN